MDLPIFVINMPQNIDRRQNIESQLSSMSLSATFIEAVVGKELTNAEVASMYDEQANQRCHHRDLSLGEIGCYASHRKIWQRMIDSNIQWSVVLEDDITVSKDIHSIIEALTDIKHTDIIKLSDNRNNPAIDSRQLSNNVTCINYKRVPNCTTGYIISLEGAKKLLSRKYFYRPVDIDLQFHSELNLSVIGLKPYCVKEAGFDSEIAAQNNGIHNNSSTFFRNIKYRIRMILQRRKVSADLNTVLNLE
ncbi:glycosyl transferase family 25 [Shewanella sp. OPT22]|nr:glycosyl transferase family 25 [Shewanella sp. OPT22]